MGSDAASEETKLDEKPPAFLPLKPRYFSLKKVKMKAKATISIDFSNSLTCV